MSGESENVSIPTELDQERETSRSIDVSQGENGTRETRVYEQIITKYRAKTKDWAHYTSHTTRPYVQDTRGAPRKVISPTVKTRVIQLRADGYNVTDIERIMKQEQLVVSKYQIKQILSMSISG